MAEKKDLNKMVMDLIETKSFDLSSVDKKKRKYKDGRVLDDGTEFSFDYY